MHPEPAFGGYAGKIEQSFARQDMMRTLGAEIIDIRPGVVTIAAPISREFCQQHGFAHAAVTFALGDSAAGYAALSLMAEHDEVLTVEMKINLTAPAAGDRLIATGRVARAGRRLTVVNASVRAENNGKTSEVAILQGTMCPVPA